MMEIGRIYVVASLLAVVAVAVPFVPMTNLYQSNGDSCESFPLDTCVPCGSSYFSCDQDEGRFSCYEFSDSSCASYVSSVGREGYCSEEACSFAALSNYQFQVSSANGLGVFVSGDGDLTGSVSLNSTDVTVVAGFYEGFVVTSPASGDVVFMEQGLFFDNTFLTNKGFCETGVWCSAGDLSYRLSPLPSNVTHYATPSSPTESGTVALHIDTLYLLTTSVQLDMYWYEGTTILQEDQIADVEVRLWPTDITWTGFQLKELYGETEIAWEMNAGSDFSIYKTEECDDDDGLHTCNIDPLLDVSGIMELPFFHPFLSMSGLFNAVEAPANDGWDEQPTFTLFD